jgi:hypothetical protein
VSELPVSQPTDATEHDADRLAGTLLAGARIGGGCPGCGRSGCTACRSKAEAGQPLDGETKSQAEPGLGRDLSGVRLHTGSEAAASAQTLGARAFAVGQDIVFGAGQFSPDTPSGQLLLFHELAHTIQDPTGRMIHRQPDAGAGGGGGAGPGTSSDSLDGGVADAGGVVAGVPPQTETSSSAAPTASGPDPCAIVAAELTNVQLLAQFAAAEAYIQNPDHYRRDDYYKYISLRRRTGSERERRAKGGECWLADNITSVPGELYRLEPGPHGSVLIVADAGGSAAGAPRSYADVSIVTANQLQSYLSNQHVEEGTINDVLQNPDKPHQVDVATAQLVWQLEQMTNQQMLSPLLGPGLGGILGTRSLDALAYSRLLTSGRGGGLSTAWLTSRGWPTIPGQQPNFLEAFTGPDLTSPLMTQQQRPGSVGLGSEGVFLPTAEQIAAFQAAGGTFLPENLPQNLPVPRLDEVMANYPLPIEKFAPGEDALRNAVARLLQQTPPEQQAALLQRLTQQMSAPNRATVTDLGPYSLDNLRPGGTLRLVYPESSVSGEVAAIMQQTWTDPQTGRVYRFEYATTPRQAPAGEAAPYSGGFGAISGPNDPVNVVVIRKVPVSGPGSITSGTLLAGGSGAAGNVAGGIITVGLGRGYAALRGQPYAGTWGEDAWNIGWTTPVAAGSSALQFQLEQYAAQRAVTGGVGALPFYLNPGAIRYGLPTATAPLITMGSMGLSSHTYPWQEYAVQGTRSAVSAGISTAATAGFLAYVGGAGATGAEAGALGGTVVEPGGGTALGGAGGWLVGVIVGSIAYFVVDQTIGSGVESLTRSIVGEPDGCP